MNTETALNITDLTEKSAEQNFAEDIRNGLSKKPCRIPSIYFYDDTGSEIFQKITAHPDYYPSYCERVILSRFAADIIDHFPDNLRIIELGCGDGHKLIPFLNLLIEKEKNIHYVPTDISLHALESLQKSTPDHISVNPLLAEHRQTFKWIKEQKGLRNIVLFLGSNTGNFSPEEEILFLNELRNSLQPGDYLLIGCDLKKDPKLLTKAYSDSDGLTAAFNLNLLNRINHELDADFNIESFDHHALYNPVKGQMESYLLSKQRQEVYIKQLNATFTFDDYEPIQTEISRKFTIHQISEIAENCRFQVIENFSDPDNFFVDSLWMAQ